MLPRKGIGKWGCLPLPVWVRYSIWNETPGAIELVNEGVAGSSWEVGHLIGVKTNGLRPPSPSFSRSFVSSYCGWDKIFPTTPARRVRSVEVFTGNHVGCPLCSEGVREQTASVFSYGQ